MLITESSDVSTSNFPIFWLVEGLCTSWLMKQRAKHSWSFSDQTTSFGGPEHRSSRNW